MIHSHFQPITTMTLNRCVYLLLATFTVARAFILPFRQASHSYGKLSSTAIRITRHDDVEHTESLRRGVNLVKPEDEELLDKQELFTSPPTAGFLLLSSVAAAAVIVGTSSPAFAATTTATTTTAASSIAWEPIITQATQKALSGGQAGATAAVVQVCTLMWLRTCMNYQYRYGGNFPQALAALWQEGGVARLYQGLPFALIQGPLTRFGDTAANVGVLVLLDTAASDLPLPVKTACGSFAAGLWRIVLMPIDSSKTALQVEGAGALQRLWEGAPASVYRGSLAQAAATAAGHFPWFLTYNLLNENIPTPDAMGVDNILLWSLLRSASLGFGASLVSDCCSNSLRVIKTTKQTAQLGGEYDTSRGELSYPDIVKMIIAKDGVGGLFGRGLQTRLATNAIQGAAFSVLWRYFQQVN